MFPRRYFSNYKYL